MVRNFLFAIPIALIWAISSFMILAPFLGIAWVVTQLTVLTLPQSCLISFAHFALVVFLLRVYLSTSGFDLWSGGVSLSIFSLATVLLEGLVLRSWTDLTLFQAVLITSGPHLLTAYIVIYSVLGKIPAFLRGTVLEDMWADIPVEEFE